MVNDSLVKRHRLNCQSEAIKKKSRNISQCVFGKIPSDNRRSLADRLTATGASQNAVERTEESYLVRNDQAADIQFASLHI